MKLIVNRTEPVKPEPDLLAYERAARAAIGLTMASLILTCAWVLWWINSDGFARAAMAELTKP